jgi:hypothetical protein
VVASFDKNFADYVEINTTGSTLVVKFKDSLSYVGTNSSNIRKMEKAVTITMPNLDALTLKGASTATVSGFSTPSDNLIILLDGASTLNWTDGAVKTSSITATGASTADFASFKTATMTASLDGASKIAGNAGTASISTLILTAKGASTMTFDVTTKASGTVEGASTFLYGLSPDVSGIRLSGGGNRSQHRP